MYDWSKDIIDIVKVWFVTLLINFITLFDNFNLDKFENQIIVLLKIISLIATIIYTVKKIKDHKHENQPTK